MLKLIVGALVVWALLTSGFTVLDVFSAATAWAVEHVEIAIR